MDYDEFRELAVELIADFGNALTATITRRTVTLDPLTGNETASTAAHVISVVVIPDADAILSPVSDRTVQFDVKFAVPATGLAIVPQPGDRVDLPERGPVVVQRCEPINPDGEPIAFFVGASNL